MSVQAVDRFKESLGDYFPSLLKRLPADGDLLRAVEGGIQALDQGSLSWARLNQILHRCSQAGMSEGFFRYYFLEVPEHHPYSVDLVFDANSYCPPQDADEIQSIRQLQWGLRRFVYDAMLYWGNFREAYRDLRQRDLAEIQEMFAKKRVDAGRLIRRGKVAEPKQINRDSRYLISELACKTYEAAPTPEDTQHVKLALQAFAGLLAGGDEVTPARLRQRTEEIAKGAGQLALFELMYEDAPSVIRSQQEVIALYSGQWRAFQDARRDALENTRVYLSICNDLDVYVATSMRSRQDFREMAGTCERIFGSPALSKYNVRYFDPTLSAAGYHEDKGIIECLMVKTSKVFLYFTQHKESLGKVSEYAMALSLGKPVIVLCPDDARGKELYTFYREAHPLMRLVEFGTGTVNGAMVTQSVDDVIKLLDRIFSNRMEYDMARKDGTDAYYLLKERLTGTSVRVITDDSLLTETFWNNWHGIH